MNTRKLLLVVLVLSLYCKAHALTDTLSLREVVVTGTRNAVDVRHLPMTVTIIGREKLTEQHHSNVLPVAMQQVPGLFVTSRSMMGYGVSTGAAGGISLRGISAGAGQMLVLIDGHPQYNGIYGHPISDSYQTLIAERIEVLRGPASVLYGSNAMGGVMNIVTRATRIAVWESPRSSVFSVCFIYLSSFRLNTFRYYIPPLPACKRASSVPIVTKSGKRVQNC